MRRLTAVPAILLPTIAAAQAALAPVQATPPTLAEVQAQMGIPSAADVRGQQDVVGYASTAEQMQRVWETSGSPPRPDSLGPMPTGTVAAVICPHDDYIYAGRSYRQVLPLLKARTVVLVGVFHRYRAFGIRDVLVFDGYRAWRAPDGEIPVSPLREALVAGLGGSMVVRSAVAHDREHSLEALAYWLRHIEPAVEIVPILVPAASFERLEEMAAGAGTALAAAMKAKGLRLGPDVAVAISSDAVHYGSDFSYTPFGDGGVGAYVNAYNADASLLSGPLADTLTRERIRAFYAACVNPADPDQYRLTWCGRFSVPFGLLLLTRTAEALGLAAPVGHPISYATSVGQPELPLREVGLGATAPANLFHFVGYPGAAYTVSP